MRKKILFLFLITVTFLGTASADIIQDFEDGTGTWGVYAQSSTSGTVQQVSSPSFYGNFSGRLEKEGGGFRQWSYNRTDDVNATSFRFSLQFEDTSQSSSNWYYVDSEMRPMFSIGKGLSCSNNDVSYISLNSVQAGTLNFEGNGQEGTCQNIDSSATTSEYIFDVSNIDYSNNNFRLEAYEGSVSQSNLVFNQSITEFQEAQFTKIRGAFTVQSTPDSDDIVYDEPTDQDASGVSTFENFQPADNSDFGVGEDITISSDVNVPNDDDFYYVEINYDGTQAETFNVSAGTSQNFNTTVSESTTRTDVSYFVNILNSTNDSVATSETRFLDVENQTSFSNFQPADQSSFVLGEDVNYSVDVTAYTEGNVDIEGIINGSINQTFNVPGQGSTTTVSFTNDYESVQTVEYRFSSITSSPSGTFINDTETRTHDVVEPTYNITFDNFQPADSSTFTEGDTINFSVDVTSDYGSQHDIEGIYDGNIETVCTHPGDNSTVNCNFSVTENNPGNYNYRFSAITSSPSGDFLADTQSRTLTVNEYPTTAVFSNFQPADGQTFNFSEQINFSVDVRVDAQQSVDIEGILDGSVNQTFSHPGDNSTQSYEFTASYDQNKTDVPYRFSAITSSPNGDFINDTETRTFDVQGFEPEDKTDSKGIFSGFGSDIAGLIASFFTGFIDGVDNQLSEGNQAMTAIIFIVLIAGVMGYITDSAAVAFATMILLVLGSTIQGWLPSWIGFVFITISAAIVALIGSRVAGGG